MATHYLTAAQAAERLGVTKRCVISLVARGHLPATEPLGRGRGYLILAAAVYRRAKQRGLHRLPVGGRPPKSNGRKHLRNLRHSC